VKAVLDGTVPSIARYVESDDRGDIHVFTLLNVGDHDLLVGVSSRRKLNVKGVGSGNLATNVLLDVLDTRDPERNEPIYGVIGNRSVPHLAVTQTSVESPTASGRELVG
jgi:hypothetical protein